MQPIKLSWSDAEVKDGELAVPLDGDVPKGWKQSFARTVALLGSGDWGEVTLKKGLVVVADVTPGSEEKLRASPGVGNRSGEHHDRGGRGA